MSISFFISGDSVGGAEISTAETIDSLQKIGCHATATFLAPSALHEKYNTSSHAFTNKIQMYSQLLKEKATKGDIIVSTHRNINHSVSVLSSAKHICVFRGIPDEQMSVRVLYESTKNWGLKFKKWESIVSQIPDDCILVCPSECLKNKIFELYKKEAIVIPNPIDLPLSSKKLNTPQVHIWARPVPWKRTEFSREAFSFTNLPDVMMLTFGDRYEGCPKIKNEFIMGWNPAPWSYANLGDIVLSMATTEAYARDAFEAYMRGCMVICVDGTPASDVVKAIGCGICLSANSSPQDLAEAINSLASIKPEHRFTLGMQAHAHVVNTISKKTVGKQWLNLISKLTPLEGMLN